MEERKEGHVDLVGQRWKTALGRVIAKRGFIHYCCEGWVLYCTEAALPSTAVVKHREQQRIRKGRDPMLIMFKVRQEGKEKWPYRLLGFILSGLKAAIAAQEKPCTPRNITWLHSVFCFGVFFSLHARSSLNSFFPPRSHDVVQHTDMKEVWPRQSRWRGTAARPLRRWTRESVS